MIVKEPQNADNGIEALLARQIGVRRVHVMDSCDDPGFARAMSAWVASLLRNGITIGLGGGSILSEVGRSLEMPIASHLSFVQLVGTYGDSTPGSQPQEVLSAFGARCPGSRLLYLPIPALLPVRELLDQAMHMETVNRTFEAMNALDMAVVEIGSLSDSLNSQHFGFITKADAEELKDAHAVGEMCCRFYDNCGTPITGNIDRRTLAATWKTLESVPELVAVARGADKVEAAVGALRSGVVDTLVTDSATALAILREHVGSLLPQELGLSPSDDWSRHPGSSPCGKAPTTATHDPHVLQRIALSLYMEGRSQEQVAHLIGVHPSTVSRYLADAERRRIITIEVLPDDIAAVSPGTRLEERFGLTKVIITEGESRDPGCSGRSGAMYLRDLLQDGLRLGLAWDPLLRDLVDDLELTDVAPLEVSQLVGSYGDVIPGTEPHELIRACAAKAARSITHFVPAPAIVESPELAAALRATPGVQEGLAAARASEVAVIGMNAADGASSVLYRYGHVTPRDIERLTAAGAVGHMCARFFDALGRPVDEELDRRTIGITWENLRNIPHVMAVVNGVENTPAVLGAIRSGIVDTLVVDEETAKAVLRAADETIRR
ncbi:MAG: helix-turn-helix domain-containing protein [Actinomycetia bacterium]|nr:helix-turn-helix domain-containing protein [Actinomycetes bacterium]